MNININFTLDKFVCLNWMLQTSLIEPIICKAIWLEINKDSLNNGYSRFIEDKYNILCIDKTDRVQIYLTDILANKEKYIGEYRRY